MIFYKLRKICSCSKDCNLRHFRKSIAVVKLQCHFKLLRCDTLFTALKILKLNIFEKTASSLLYRLPKNFVVILLQL